LIEYGVLDLCLDALKKFDECTDLLCSACILLANFTMNESLAVQVFSKGDLEAVLSAMKGRQ